MCIDYSRSLVHNDVMKNGAANFNTACCKPYNKHKGAEAAGKTANQILEDQTMSMNEMEIKVNELRELRRMADELAGEIATLEDSLKAHMDSLGTDELHGPSLKITWKQITSSRLDTTALKKALPDVAARFQRQTTSRRFIVA